jgi:hypothetical protein
MMPVVEKMRELLKEKMSDVQKEVESFLTDLNSLEKEMDLSANHVADIYFPLMQEVSSDELEFMKGKEIFYLKLAL